MEKGENDKTANGGRKGGRPEILTESLARKICRLIETFPDNEIEVNWNNVTTQVKHKFKHGIGRRALSQKSWGGRKLIAEAFDEAKDVQRRLGNDGGKRHATTSRQKSGKRLFEVTDIVIDNGGVYGDAGILGARQR